MPRMSVVFGTRSSSSTSTVTFHSLPFRSMPVTPSTGRPISCWSWRTASIAKSCAERPSRELSPEDLRLPSAEDLRLRSAILIHLVIPDRRPFSECRHLLGRPPPGDREPVEQLMLYLLSLLIADPTVVMIDLELDHL